MGYCSAIVVLDTAAKRVLLLKSTQEETRGLYTFVGGPCDPGEDALACAHRLLQEQTGLDMQQAELAYCMDFAHPATGWVAQVFSGKVKSPWKPDKEDLCWFAVDTDFTDADRFAGEGVIGHVLTHLDLQGAE